MCQDRNLALSVMSSGLFERKKKWQEDKIVQGNVNI